MNALVNPPGYRLGQLLHTSSRTLVYRGLRDRDRVPVIVKILRNPFPTFNELVRFRNQYVIARHLEHPHIVTPLALDRYGNGYALIMPDGEGLSLRDDWRNGDRSLAEFLAIAVQLADALHYLGRQRIIHKDIKPGNVLIHPDTRQVQLIDFSIASRLPKERQQLTSPKVLEGTLAYLSPEQTGRMNRGIDYRTDFYSLGVVLYELLTGVLPFQSQDPMALIHCHIAQTPLAPHHFLDTRGKRYPEVLSEIVLKLMAKNAEDRYQSALGLKWDLQRCQQQLDATGTLARFPLGERDAGDRFLLPEKLYGREKEVRALLDAFDRVSGGAGRVEMMRVTGFSGIGKTAVVNEIHRPVVRQRGYFIKGKFDQFNRKVPFFGVLQALRDLMRQLLSESDAQLQVWKAKILAAVGENGQILINALPELQEIIGAQPPAIELSGTAARDRFHWLFQAFIGVFTTPEHPLVMFLDDLQWVDSASLNLIHLLMTELDGGSLLLVGAYRDREVSPVHSLMLVLERITRAGATIETIVLQPLSQPDINRLIADTLHCSEELAHPLADLVYRRTRGNPFFTAQFLRALYEDGAIAFDPRRGGWQCDLAKVREACLTDDVVAFMALQLQKFPEATREALKLAACIGNTFDLATLAIVCETTPEEVAGNLWHGLQEGFVLPESEIYKFFQGDEDEQRDAKSKIFSSQPDRVAYRFVHDRVQQAAYSLIPEAQKQVTHLKIGQLLLQNKPDRVRDENIFALVNHLNYGATLLTQGAERDRLARLNLMAGRRALTANAAEAAAEYLRNGRDLLPENSWELDYSLTLALYSLSVESAYLNSDFEGIEKLATLVEHRAATLLDRIKVCEIKIQARSAQNKLTEAVAIGLAVLEQLGVSFPETIAPADIENGFQAIDRHLTDAAIEALIDLPLMKDPEKRAAMLILTNIFIPVYITAPERLPLLVCQQVLLSLQYGNAPESAVAYTNYGLILCGVIGDIDKGYRFGKLGLAVLDRLHINRLKSKVFNVAYACIVPWKQPLQLTLKPLQASYTSGLETGDLEFAGYGAFIYCYILYFVGDNLAEVAAEMEKYHRVLQKIKQETSANYLAIYWQSVLNLQGEQENPWCLRGSVYDERQKRSQYQNKNDITALGYLSLNQLILCYLFGEFQQGMESAAEFATHLEGQTATVTVPLFYFYDTLTRLAMYRDAPVDSEERKTLLSRAIANQEKMKNWAHHAPMNYLHKWELGEAEKHRVLGNYLEAIEIYDRAIAGAKTNKYRQEESLANELAAQFYLDWGKEKVAAGYMQEAYYGYAQWGAKAKTDALERDYPHLLSPILQKSADNPRADETLTQTSAFDRSLHLPPKHGRVSNADINIALDLAAILNASQSLSSIIQLDALLQQLTQIILQNSGGDRCALILPDGEGIWKLAATADLAIAERRSQPLEDCPHLPVRLIQYVKNTREIVAIDALETDLPVIDAYLTREKPQSVLCLPLLNQGNLIGILYLSNQGTRGVFTRDRLLVLSFLCTQAAISLENARLYQREREKAEQLQLSESRFKQLFTKAADAILLLGESGFLDCNQATVDLFRCSEKTQFYTLDFTHISPEFQPDGQRSREKARAAIRAAKQEGSYQFEWVYRRCDGALFWAEVVLTAIPHWQETLVHALIRDISDRKEAERQLRASEQRYATLAAAVPVGIFRTDAMGSCLYVNDRWCQIAGLPPEAAAGDGWVQALHPEDRHRIVAAWQQAVRENRLFQEECRFQRPDGTIIWVYGQSVVERDAEGEIVGYVGTLTDIGDRKRAEAEREQLLGQQARLNRELEAANQQLADYSHTLEQKVEERTAALNTARERIIAQEKLASLGTLTAGVAHELRNPLNFVKNFAEGSVELARDLLEELQPALEALEPETRALAAILIADLQDNATTIRDHSQRAAQIIDSMMQHTPSNAQSVSPQPIALNTVLARAVKLVYHSHQDRDSNFDLSLSTDYAVELEPIEGVPGNLMRAFINLIDNACDAMRQKQQRGGNSNYTPTLAIATCLRENGVEIRIRDNGCGIDPDIREKILDPFFTTKPPGEGTGLGLSLTHDIIAKQHQGTLSIESQLGEFTEIILVLPRS